jgi:hypothetical protein
MPTEPIVTPETPEKVTFSEVQQARVNEIIRDAMARAGSEARTETARVTAELAAAKLPGTEDAVKLATANAELGSLRAEKAEASVAAVLRAAVGTTTFFDPELASQILRSSIKIVEGKPVVIGQDGQPRLNASFDPMSPAELAQELAASKPFLVRGTVGPGLGSSQRSDAVSHERIPLESIFGRGSDGGAANRLAMRSPKEYQRLKLAAREKGLIS